MRYVSSALFAEGPTDVRFLTTILSRCLEDVLIQFAQTGFILADMVPLGESSGLAEPREVADTVLNSGKDFDVVFVHRDADARDIDQKARRWCEEVITMTTPDFQGCLIFAVPVRMIEAWTLADGDALRRVLGVTWSNDEMQIPNIPSGVERLQEPKTILRRVVNRCSGPPIDIFARLGEMVDIDVLRQVSSFA